jgi:hypothetical protein
MSARTICGYCGADYTPGTPAMYLHLKSQHPGLPSQWKRVTRKEGANNA